MGDYRWVSCSREVNHAVARQRHVIQRGGITTLCGCTASLPEIWRGNSTKPECEKCAALLAERELMERLRDSISAPVISDETIAEVARVSAANAERERAERGEYDTFTLTIDLRGEVNTPDDVSKVLAEVAELLPTAVRNWSRSQSGWVLAPYPGDARVGTWNVKNEED